VAPKKNNSKPIKGNISQSQNPVPKKLSDLPGYLAKGWKAFFLDQKEDLKIFRPALEDAIRYFPYIVTLFFVLFILRMTGYKHQIGNFGEEEAFFNLVLPVVESLRDNWRAIFKIKILDPAYPLLVSVLTRVFSMDPFKVALYLNAVLSGVVLLGLYFIAKKVFNRITAAMVLLLLATNKGFVEFSYLAGGGVFFLSLATLAIIFFKSWGFNPCFLQCGSIWNRVET